MTSITPTRTLRRAARGLVAGAVAALALAGCMRLDLAMTVTSDDTVEASMLLAFSDDVARERLGMDPQELWEQAGEGMLGDLPGGAVQEPYSADGFTGARITLPSRPLEEMSGLGAEEITIERDGDELVLAGTMDLTDTDLDAFGDIDIDGMDLRVRVTFPGEVTEHNGTLDGTTVTWEPQLGEVNEMHARALADGGGAAAGAGGEDGNTGLFVGIIAAGAVVVAVAAALWARAYRAAKASAAADSATPEYVLPAATGATTAAETTAPPAAAPPVPDSGPTAGG